MYCRVSFWSKRAILTILTMQQRTVSETSAAEIRLGTALWNERTAAGTASSGKRNRPMKNAGRELAVLRSRNARSGSLGKEAETLDDRESQIVIKREKKPRPAEQRGERQGKTAPGQSTRRGEKAQGRYRMHKDSSRCRKPFRRLAA